MGSASLDWGPAAWKAVGIAGSLIFFGRFYVQWIVSERAGRSVVPVAFWYMSTVGALLLFAYGVYERSPVGTLSFGFNIVVYARNLVHIWRGAGTLSRTRWLIAHGLVAAVLSVAAVLVAYTWLHELHATRTADSAVVRQTWFWIGVGVVGQGLFACRFALQWMVTEARRESVIPAAFWYFSLAASILLMSSYTQRGEWIYVAGQASTLPVYARNIWLIHWRGTPAPPGE